MIQAGQTWQRKADSVRALVVYVTTGYVELRIGTHTEGCTPAALETYYTLIEDVCGTCKNAWTLNQLDYMPGPFGGYVLVCPNCRHDGPAEPVTRAAQPREV